MKHDVNILSLIRFWLAYPLFRLSGAIGGQFFRRVMVESFTEAIGANK